MYPHLLYQYIKALLLLPNNLNNTEVHNVILWSVQASYICVWFVQKVLKGVTNA